MSWLTTACTHGGGGGVLGVGWGGKGLGERSLQQLKLSKQIVQEVAGQAPPPGLPCS